MSIKYIDSMSREEYLTFRFMKHENDRLQKRLSAIELMKQGKLV